jgi:hypothetical protein
MGSFVADFACLERKLVIEVDGGQHDGSSDGNRSAWFQQQGYSVLRFWNNDVLSRTQDVLEEILKALGSACPHPNLPRKRGKEPRRESPAAASGGRSQGVNRLPPQAGEGAKA